MEQTTDEKIMALEVSDEILARAIIEQQKNGQISPGTMEELLMIRGKE